MLLALDLATNTGFAVGDPAAYQCATALEAAAGAVHKPYSGVFKVAPRRTIIGVFLSNYDTWLNDIISVHGVTKIVFEAPLLRGSTSIDTARKLMGLAGHTEFVAHRRGVTKIWEANNATVRKHFIGKGNGKSELLKRMALEKCRSFGWEVDSHDEADALGLYDYAVHCLKSKRRAA